MQLHCNYSFPLYSIYIYVLYMYIRAHDKYSNTREFVMLVTTYIHHKSMDIYIYMFLLCNGECSIVYVRQCCFNNSTAFIE